MLGAASGCDGLRCGSCVLVEFCLHIVVMLSSPGSVLMGGLTSDHPHGSIDKILIGDWENDGVDMIQAHDISDKVGANVDDARRAHGHRELMATDDGPSAEEYDEIAMVDEDVKRMIDLATKL